MKVALLVWLSYFFIGEVFIHVFTDEDYEYNGDAASVHALATLF